MTVPEISRRQNRGGKKKEKKNEHRRNYIASPTGIANNLFYIPWPFPPVWGVADNTKETKTLGVSLCSSSNDEGPSRVWIALLEQHSPSSPVFHNNNNNNNNTTVIMYFRHQALPVGVCSPGCNYNNNTVVIIMYFRHQAHDSFPAPPAVARLYQPPPDRAPFTPYLDSLGHNLGGSAAVRSPKGGISLPSMSFRD